MCMIKHCCFCRCCFYTYLQPTEFYPAVTTIYMWIYLYTSLHHTIHPNYLQHTFFVYVCDDYLEKFFYTPFIHLLYTVNRMFAPQRGIFSFADQHVFFLQSRANFRRFLFCRKHASYILAVNVLSIPLTLNRMVCLPDVIFFSPTAVHCI